MTPEKFNPHARRKARRLALQALYQWHVSKNDILKIESEFVTENDMSKIDEAFFLELLRDLPPTIQVIDEQFQPHLDRDFKSLNPIELTCLRMGTYELMQRMDIPYKVVINEAVELTKKFGTVEGYKYVNGILDKVARDVRPEFIHSS